MSPIKVLYVIGIAMISSWIPACCAHLIIRAESKTVSKKQMLSAIDPEKSWSDTCQARSTRRVDALRDNPGQNENID